MDTKKLTALAGIGGALAALGTFLPWWTPGALPFGIVGGSHNGLDFSMGWLVLVGGAAGAATYGLDALGKGSLIKMPAKTKTMAGMVGLIVAAAVTLLRFFDFPPLGDRGFGLWLCLLGSVAGAAAAIMLFKGKGGAAPAA